jgi:hypothetical protein
MDGNWEEIDRLSEEELDLLIIANSARYMREIEEEWEDEPW